MAGTAAVAVAAMPNPGDCRPRFLLAARAVVPWFVIHGITARGRYRRLPRSPSPGDTAAGGVLAADRPGGGRLQTASCCVG